MLVLLIPGVAMGGGGTVETETGGRLPLLQIGSSIIAGIIRCLFS